MRLEFQGVSKSFGEVEALRGLTLAVEPGSLHCIIGPSGAGKTTLIRIAAGLEAPTRGEVLADGRPPDPASPLPMAAVLQKPVVFRRTVFENVAYGLRLRHAPPGKIREKVGDALRRVGLEGLERRPARTLSGGQAQRVAFARAMVLEPRLLLLDEFTANLNPAHARVLEQAVRDYRQRTGATVLLTTHDLFQARRMADRITLLLDGRAVEMATPEEFFTHPQTPEGRAFVQGEL